MLSGDAPGADHLDVAASLVIEGVAAPEITSWSFTRDLALRTPGVDTVSPAAGEGEVRLAPAAVAVTGSASPWRTGEDASPSPSASGVLTLALSPDHAWPVATCRVDAPEGSMWDGSVGVKLIDPIDALAVPLSWEPMHARQTPLGPGAQFRWVGLCNAYVIDRAMRDAGFYSTPPASPSAALDVPMVGSLWPRRGLLERSDAPYPSPIYSDTMPQGVALKHTGSLNTWRVVNNPTGNFECSMEVDTSRTDLGAVHWWIIDAAGAGKGYRLHYAHSSRQFAVWRAERDTAGNLTTVGSALVTVTLPAGEHRVVTRIRRYQNSAGDLPEVAVRRAGASTEWTSSTLAESYLMGQAEFWRVYLTTVNDAVAGAFLIDTPATPWASAAWTPNVVTGYTWGSIDALKALPRITRATTALDLIRDQARAEVAAWGFDEQGRLFYYTRAYLTSRPLARTFTSADLVDYSWTHSSTTVRSHVTVTHQVPAIIGRRHPSVTVYQGRGAGLDAGETGTIFMAPEGNEDWVRVDPDADEVGFTPGSATNWNAGRGSFWGGALVDGTDGTDSWAHNVAGHLTGDVRAVDEVTWAFDYEVAETLPADTSVELRTPESTGLRRRGVGLPILRAYGATRWLDRETTTTAGSARAPRLVHDVAWHVQDGNALAALRDWLASHVASPRPRLQGVTVKPDPRVQVGDRVRVVDDRPGGTGADVTGLVMHKTLSGGPGAAHMTLDIMEV